VHVCKTHWHRAYRYAMALGIQVQQLSFRTEFLNLEQTAYACGLQRYRCGQMHAAKLSSSSTCESKYCHLSTSLTDYEPAKLCTRPIFSYTELVIDFHSVSVAFYDCITGLHFGSECPTKLELPIPLTLLNQNLTQTCLIRLKTPS